MRLLCLAVFASLVAARGTEAPAAGASPLPDLASLRVWLGDHLGQSRFAQAQWGVLIMSLDTGAELFATNEGKLFVPASNTKLFTGALALDTLGPDFRVRTSLYGHAAPDRRGRLRGDLVVYGRGDPTLAAKFHEGDLGRALAPLADAAVRAGLKRVDGSLIADDSFFRGPPLGSGWDWDDLEFYYGAPVSALSVNENVLSIIARPAGAAGRPALLSLDPACSFLGVSNDVLTTVAETRAELTVNRPLGSPLVIARGAVPVGATSVAESVSVPAPARWFGELLAAELKQRGVPVRRGVQTRSTVSAESRAAAVDGVVELGAIESAPLAALLPLMMKPSQNLHAQIWLLQSGVAWERRFPGDARFSTTERAGLAALTNFLGRAGVDVREVMFEEGTGLSRRNVVTPRAVVQLLRHMDTHPYGAIFHEALPVAGRDGTLRARMRATAAAGNARAKTGYLAFTYSLSGYVTTAAGERLVFALLLNNYQPPNPDRPARGELDEIVVALAGLESRTKSGE